MTGCTILRSRFTQTDPLQASVGSAYPPSYVSGADIPVMFTDPSGLREGSPCSGKRAPSGLYPVAYKGACYPVPNGRVAVDKGGELYSAPGQYCGATQCRITIGDVLPGAMQELSAFWNRNSSKFAVGTALLGFGACVLVTGGACAVIAGGVVGLSGAGNLVMYLGGDKSGWQAIGSTALDLPGLLVPGVGQNAAKFAESNLSVLAEKLAGSGAFRSALLRAGYEAKKVIVTELAPAAGQLVVATRTVACAASWAKNYACQ
jgi:hypothetical protein